MWQEQKGQRMRSCQVEHDNTRILLLDAGQLALSLPLLAKTYFIPLRERQANWASSEDSQFNKLRWRVFDTWIESTEARDVQVSTWFGVESFSSAEQKDMHHEKPVLGLFIT